MLVNFTGFLFVVCYIEQHSWAYCGKSRRGEARVRWEEGRGGCHFNHLMAEEERLHEWSPSPQVVLR